MTSSRASSACKIFFVTIALAWQNINGQQWQNQVDLEPNGGYSVFFDWDEEKITIEVQVRTNGYVGFGFSPNGGMEQADIFTGWVKDSKVYFQDRYGIGNSEPIIDDHQDYELLSGFENDTHTVLKFRRLLDTCDEQDYQITKNTIFLIYAWKDGDPASENDIEYHGVKTRGTLAFNPFDNNTKLPDHPDDVFFVDFQMPNITIPVVDSLYWCKYFKILPTQVKQHILGMVITLGNEKVVHHMLFMFCDDSNSKEIESKLHGGGYNCLITPECKAFYGWNNGQRKEDRFPNNTGFPYGKENESTYFLLNIHYNNPEGTVVVDNTTVQLAITNDTKYVDSGTLTISILPTENGIIIPPNQSNFRAISTCPSTITKMGIPEDGIYVYAYVLHAHKTGSKVYIRHYRNGFELPMIAAEKHFSYKYELKTFLRKEIHILPGDDIVGECIYNTAGISEFTLGGTSTQAEMCIFYIFYHPLADLDSCMRLPPSPQEQQLFHIDNIVRIALNNSTTTNYTDKDVAALQNYQLTGKMNILYVLSLSNTTKYISTDPPNITPAAEEPRTCDGFSKIN